MIRQTWRYKWHSVAADPICDISPTPTDSLSRCSAASARCFDTQCVLLTDPYISPKRIYHVSSSLMVENGVYEQHPSRLEPSALKVTIGIAEGSAAKEGSERKLWWAIVHVFPTSFARQRRRSIKPGSLPLLVPRLVNWRQLHGAEYPPFRLTAILTTPSASRPTCKSFPLARRRRRSSNHSGDSTGTKKSHTLAGAPRTAFRHKRQKAVKQRASGAF